MVVLADCKKNYSFFLAGLTVYHCSKQIVICKLRSQLPTTNYYYPFFAQHFQLFHHPRWLPCQTCRPSATTQSTRPSNCILCRCQRLQILCPSGVEIVPFSRLALISFQFVNYCNSSNTVNLLDWVLKIFYGG